jgi:putative copper resistance protein D
VTSPATALVFCRISFYAAVSVLYGCGCFVAFLAPPRLGQEISNPFRTPGVVALLASLAWLPIQAAVIGDGWTSALDWATLSALSKTTGGTAWFVRCALALSITSVILARPHARAARAAIGALLMASLVLSGHAEMDEGARRALHILNHILHLLSGGFWVGSLVALPAALARLRDPALCADTKIALRRFSSAGHIAVSLVVITGILNTALILRRWPDDLASHYQLLLDAKIVLVIAMASLAVIQPLRFRAAPSPPARACGREHPKCDLCRTRPRRRCFGASRDFWPNGP